MEPLIDWVSVTLKAADFARERHTGHFDLAGEPYVWHLSRVAEAVPMGPARPVAWLHDIVEDGKASIGELQELVPSRCVTAVQALTKSKTAKSDDDYRQYIKELAFDPIARMVKEADLEDNMRVWRLNRDLTYRDVQRLNRYIWAHNYLRAAERLATS